MTLKLVVTTNVDGDVFELVLKNARYGVGRRPDNDLRIKETYISGYHAELVRDASGNYGVADLGSSNGTFLNGRRIAGREVIKAGDVLKFGILKVEVKEQAEGMPKIVALKDHPAFSKPETAATGAIAVGKKNAVTAAVASVPAREPVKTGASSEALEKMWQARLDAEKKIASELQKSARAREDEVKALQREISEVRESLGRVESENASIRKDAGLSAKEARSAGEKLEQRGIEVEKLKASVAAQDLELTRLRAKVEEEQAHAAAAAKEQARIDRSAKDQADRDDARVKQLTGDLESARADLDKLRQQLEVSTAKVAEAGRERSNLEKASKETSSRLEVQSKQLAKELASSRSELEKTRQELDELQSAATEAAKERDLLRKAVQEKDREISGAEAKLGKSALLTATVKELTEKLAGFEADLNKEAKARESAERELGIRESELAAGRGRIEFLQAELDRQTNDASAAKDGLAREVDDLRKRVETSAAEMARLASERDESKRMLEHGRAEAGKEEARAKKERTVLAARVADLEKVLESARKEIDEKGAALLESESRSGDLESKVAELAPLSAKLATVESALREALASGDSLVEDKASALARIAELEEKLKGEAEVRADLVARLEERSAQISAVEEEKLSLVSSFEKSRNEANQETKAAVEALKSELGDLESKLRATESKLSESRRLFAEAEKRSASLAKECDQWKERSGAAGENLEELKARLKVALETGSALSAEKDALVAEAAKQNDAIRLAKAESNELRLELNRLREESEKSLDELNGKLRSRVGELDTHLSRERIRAEEAEQNLATLRGRLGELETELKGSRGESEQLRSRGEESSRTIGRLQAELNREVAERTRLSSTLEEKVEQSNRHLAEIDELKLALESKEREIVEREQQIQHAESETVQKLRAAMAEQKSVQVAAEERAAKAQREKQTLSGSFERLRVQLEQTGEELRRAREIEEELKHAKGLLARRLEKEEASNTELAARIKEEAIAALANKELIEKLEQQIRENESEAVRREHEQVLALQADLSRAGRRAAEDERRRRELEAEVEKLQDLRRRADDEILGLGAMLMQRESETNQTRDLLSATEGMRVELATRLAGESSTVESQARAIEALRQELAETHARFTTAEAAMVNRHQEEMGALLGDLRSEKSRREGLEVDLANTREGLSAALRQAREDSVKKQAALLAQGNEKLSAVEDELTAVIRSREEVELQRNALEDELNQREEEIEALAERVEDLEIRLREEFEARQVVHRNLESTRDGFSTMLRANWGHLADARSQLAFETEDRIEAESELSRTRDEVARLNAALDDSVRERRTVVREWEDRYETLRQEKLTLASEDADLRQIREQILSASGERRAIEDEISSLSAALRESQIREAEFRAQRETLLAEREQLKAGLNAARLELSLMQKRTVEFRDQAVKQEETIASAERRIQSLRKLETEIENAVERKRQQQLLSRGDVFSDFPEISKTAAENVPDEEFFRKLIAKLDLIDDLAKRYDNKWLYPRVAEQLGVLKRSFVDFLQDHSVRQFDLQPGTVLSLAERKRIKLVPNGARKPENGSNGQPSCVVETLRPGYVFQNGSKDVIIRKAEVVVS